MKGRIYGLVCMEHDGKEVYEHREDRWFGHLLFLSCKHYELMYVILGFFIAYFFSPSCGL